MAKSNDYRIEVFIGKDGWRWRIVAANGETLGSSEAYASKQKAQQTAKRLSDATGFTVFVEAE